MRVEADARFGDIVEDEHVGALALELRARPVEPALARLGREADDDLIRRDGLAPIAARTSVVGSSSSVHSSASFGRFAVKRSRGPVVGHGCRHDNHVGL